MELVQNKSKDEYVIEKDIPVPVGRGHYDKYPFKQMEIGDSFLVANKDIGNSLRNAISTINKQYSPKHFITRTLDEGIRVWRDQ